VQGVWGVFFAVATGQVRYFWRAFWAGRRSSLDPESLMVEELWATPVSELQQRMGLPVHLTDLRVSPRRRIAPPALVGPARKLEST